MNILLVGNFGAGNYGDEAILIAFLQKMLATYSKAVFTIPTVDKGVSQAFMGPFFDKKDIERIQFIKRLPFGIRSAFKSLFTWRKLVNQYKGVDLGIYCGGGLFSDEESSKTCLMWASYGYLLSKFNKPILSFGLGIGPLQTETSKSIVSKLLSKMSFIGVRDEISMQIVNDLGDFKAKSFLTEDSVFLFDTAMVRPTFVRPRRTSAGRQAHHDIEYQQPYIVVSLRSWKNFNEMLYKKIAQALDKTIEGFGFNIVLMPFSETPQNDEEVLHKIIEHSKHGEHIFLHKWSTNLLTILNILKHAKLTIGMRLHSNLLSLLLDIPFIILSYAEKARSFIRKQNLGSCQLDLDQLAMDKLYGKIYSFIQNIYQDKVKLDSVKKTCIATAESSFEILRRYI